MTPTAAALALMDARSERRLIGVHPDLVRVIRRALQLPQPFCVVQGLRPRAAEADAVRTGHSTTMHSRHLAQPGQHGMACAVDVAALIDGQPDFAKGREAQIFGLIWSQIRAAGVALAIPLEWGGDWHSFKDWGHVQLPWSTYP